MHMGPHPGSGRTFHQADFTTASVADDSTITLTSTYCGVGVVLIWESDRGYNGYSFLGYNGSAGAAGNYGTFSNGDTDGAHCVYSNGAHSSTYKNRTGATRNMTIIIYGSRFGG